VNFVRLRLEGSLNGSTFFPISDEFTSQYATSGAIIGTGYYPVIRLNLLTFSAAPGITLTAAYSGTSAANGIPLGNFNRSQLYSSTVFVDVTPNQNHTTVINTVNGTSCGYLSITPQVYTPNTTVLVEALRPEFPNPATTIALVDLSTGAPSMIPMPCEAAPSIQVTYTPAGAGAPTNLSASYIFTAGDSFPPSAQPLKILNSETTALAGSASASLSGSSNKRVTVYSVSARCSAGSAGITITDGSTQIWSSGSSEVGTSTFKFQWNPGLSGRISLGVTVTLTTCGGGNTGTLDVQASQY
jgi:hypothetical protein